MKTVLFVCSGNTFRSASAEYLLRSYLKKNNIRDVKVHSAGIRGGSHLKPFMTTFEILERLYGIDMKPHISRKITQEIVDESDIIICMSHVHQSYLKEHFGRDTPLFLEAAEHLDQDLPDDGEAKVTGKELDPFIETTISFIHDEIPRLYQQVIR